MKEINEKDFEQAAGGLVGYNQKCDKYEPRDYMDKLKPSNLQNCSDCIHYTIYGKCDLQQSQGE